jgi:hypothetical protein
MYIQLDDLWDAPFKEPVPCSGELEATLKYENF